MLSKILYVISRTPCDAEGSLIGWVRLVFAEPRRDHGYMLGCKSVASFFFVRAMPPKHIMNGPTSTPTCTHSPTSAWHIPGIKHAPPHQRAVSIARCTIYHETSFVQGLVHADCATYGEISVDAGSLYSLSSDFSMSCRERYMYNIPPGMFSMSYLHGVPFYLICVSRLGRPG